MSLPVNGKLLKKKRSRGHRGDAPNVKISMTEFQYQIYKKCLVTSQRWSLKEAVTQESLTEQAAITYTIPGGWSPRTNRLTPRIISTSRDPRDENKPIRR